jgi:opacity protein-like surface antigen
MSAGFDEGMIMVLRFAIPTLAVMAALTASPVVRAADLPMPPVVAQPEVSNWYLRGFVGIGMNGTPTLDYLPAPANVGNGFAFDQNSIADTTFIGAGVVYDQVTGQGDAYQGYLKSWVVLANGFVDLGTWNCFTPFVGVGIGGAYNQMADLVDMGIGQTGAGFGRNTAEWHMAYAFYAGIGYEVSKNLKIDLSYRYLNYGSITDTIDCIGGCSPDSYKFGNLYSQDIMLGLRWTCCETAPPPRYVYTPPPAYTPPPPPLSSRG